MKTYTCYLKYDGQPIEWNGIVPDIQIINSRNELDKGIDNQLAFSINYLITK